MLRVWSSGFADVTAIVAMVPVSAAVGQRLSRRLSPGSITALGCRVFAVGIGPALPTILSAVTADLPAARSATGSAVVDMSRQIGAVLGMTPRKTPAAVAPPVLVPEQAA